MKNFPSQIDVLQNVPVKISGELLFRHIHRLFFISYFEVPFPKLEQTKTASSY